MKYTHTDFEKAFSESNLSKNEKEMLRLNYYAVGHTITSKQMAEKLGFNHYGAANLHYGKLASKIGRQLQWEPLPKEHIGVFVEFHKFNEEWHWILWPEVASALENLKWVEIQEFKIPEEEVEISDRIFEGATKRISVNIYERNPKARSECLKHFGANCQICKINLENIYGMIGKNYIHVHHIKQLSDIKDKYQVNPLTDLIPVCPNCHSMLHRKSPAYTPDELKQLIKSK